MWYKCSSFMSCTLVNRLRVRLTAPSGGASAAGLEFASIGVEESYEPTLDIDDDRASIVGAA